MFVRDGKVAPHVESPEGVRAALENGVDTIEHGAMPDESTLALFRKTGASLVTTISPALSYALFDTSVSHATPMQKYNGKIVMDGIVGCAKACLSAGIPVGLGTDTACPYVTQYDTWRELVYFRRFCGVTAHHHDEVGVLDVDPVVGHRTATKCWSKTCYRWSVSDTRLVVDREHTQRAGEFLR